MSGCQSRSPEYAVVFPGEKWQTATPESQGLDSAKVEAAVQVIEEGFPGRGSSRMLIVRNGYVIWQGDAVEEVGPIFSCTKSYMSACFGLLWDDGTVKPDDLAHQGWPALKEHYPTVTLEHLGTLTGGYQWDEDADHLTPAPPAFPPGTHYKYGPESNLFGAVLTGYAGRSLKDIFLEGIGDPIGFDRDAFEWGKLAEVDGITINGGAGQPASAVHTNALNMARFGWLFCNDGKWEDRKSTRLNSSHYS